MTAGRDDNILFAIHFVSHRSRLAAGWQTGFPQFLTIAHIVRAQVVIRGRADEQDVTRRGDWPTQHRHTHGERQFNRHRERQAILRSTDTFFPYHFVGF